VDIRVTGADQLAAVAKRLKDAGDRTLRRELLSGIRLSTRPLIASVREAARTELPKRGGLAARVAESKIGVRTTSSGSRVGVRIVAKSGFDLDAIDKGQVRHPVFGHLDRWVVQPVEPGWWSQTLADGAPVVRAALIVVMDAVARKVEG